MKRGAIIGALLLIIFIGAIAIVYNHRDEVKAGVDVTALTTRMRGQWWAPFAFVAIYSLAAVIIFPTQPLSIAAVLIWGWRVGGAIELVAATIAAACPYFIARGTGRHWIEPRLKHHARIAALLDREGFMLVLILRVTSMVPYPVLNYLAGCSTVRLLPYLGATIVGMVPSVFIFAYFVEAVAAGLMRPREVAFRVIGAGLLFAIFAIGTRVAVGAVRRRLDQRNSTS
jgi:uncharacterized membrane protein YdjX (TVP38/TMEM64 family)